MVKPCDKYQGLVVGPDGQTVTDMWGVLPTLGDYEEWRGVAHGLITRAETELTKWFEEHGAIPDDLYLPVEAVRARWDAMGGVLEQSFTDPTFLWSSDITKMVEIAKDAACQIGVVEAERVKLGGTPTDLPTPRDPMPPGGSSSKGGGKGMGLGLVLLVGAWALFGGRDR